MAAHSVAACRSAAALNHSSVMRASQQLSESAFVPSFAGTQNVVISRKHCVGSRTFREKREQMRAAAKLVLHGPAEMSSQGRGSVRTRFATDSGAESSSWEEELRRRKQEDVSPSRRSPYIAEAAVGMVVCSARGCRPVFFNSDDAGLERESSETAVCTAERAGEDWGNKQGDLGVKKKLAYPDGFVEYLKEVWMEKDVAQRLYEKELQQNPRSAKILASYATFAYKEQNDIALADRLYRQALQEAPDNADVLSSYALFLWQTEA